MGGKSRKSGEVSKRLIERLKRNAGERRCCGRTKKVSSSYKPLIDFEKKEESGGE